MVIMSLHRRRYTAVKAMESHRAEARREAHDLSVLEHEASHGATEEDRRDAAESIRMAREFREQFPWTDECGTGSQAWDVVEVEVYP